MKVRALSTVTIGPGTVMTLTERQAARRGAVLQAEGNGRYRATALVQFKAGEEFGVDADLPKALADVLETDAPVSRAAGAKRQPASKSARVVPVMLPAAPETPAPTLVDPARLDIE